MSETYTLATDTDMALHIQRLADMRLAGKTPVVTIEDSTRTLSQNDMIYALYGQIAEQADDKTVLDVRRECKLRYGVPILRAGSQKFRDMYDKAFKNVFTYEEKLEYMDFLPVTSLMKKKQCTEYIDTVIREHTSQGYFLADPRQMAESLGRRAA